MPCLKFSCSTSVKTSVQQVERRWNAKGRSIVFTPLKPRLFERPASVCGEQKQGKVVTHSHALRQQRRTCAGFQNRFFQLRTLSKKKMADGRTRSSQGVYPSSTAKIRIARRLEKVNRTEKQGRPSHVHVPFNLNDYPNTRSTSSIF